MLSKYSHPSSSHRIPHQFITEMMAYTFTQIVNRLNSKLPLIMAAKPNFPKEPVFFTDVESKTMCFPALSSFTTLDDSTDEIATAVSNNEHRIWPGFAPYKCSLLTKWCRYKKKEAVVMDHLYYKGWTFAQDRAGKC